MIRRRYIILSSFFYFLKDIKTSDQKKIYNFVLHLFNSQKIRRNQVRKNQKKRRNVVSYPFVFQKIRRNQITKMSKEKCNFVWYVFIFQKKLDQRKRSEENMQFRLLPLCFPTIRRNQLKRSTGNDVMFSSKFPTHCFLKFRRNKIIINQIRKKITREDTIQSYYFQTHQEK